MDDTRYARIAILAKLNEKSAEHMNLFTRLPVTAALLALVVADPVVAASQPSITTEWLRNAAPGVVGRLLLDGVREEIAYVEPVRPEDTRRRERSDATRWPADQPTGAVLYSRAKPGPAYCVSTRFEVTFDEALQVYAVARRPAFAVPTRDLPSFQSQSAAGRTAACASLRGGDIYTGFGSIGLNDQLAALDRAVRSARTARPALRLSCQDWSMPAVKAADVCRDFQRRLADLDLRRLQVLSPSTHLPDQPGILRDAARGARVTVANFRPEPSGDFWQVYVEWRPGPAGPHPTEVVLTRQTTIILTAG